MYRPYQEYEATEDLSASDPCLYLWEFDDYRVGAWWRVQRIRSIKAGEEIVTEKVVGPSSNYLAPAFQLPGGIYTWEGRYGSWPTVDEMLYKAETVRGAPPTEQTIAFHETAKEVFEIQVHQQQHEERARARHLSVFGPHLTKVR